MSPRIEAILDAEDNDNLDLAWHLAEQLLADAPNNAGAWAARARLHCKLGDDEAAVADIAAALKLDPRCTDALWVRTTMIDDDARAVAEYDRILQQDPDHYGCLMSRGWSLAQLDRTDDAVASCAAALRVRPRRQRPANNAVHFLMEAGRVEEASAFYERLAAARPDDGMTAYNAGTHYYQINEYEKAIVHLDRSRRLLGEQNAIQHNRALTLQMLGRHAEAVEEWSNVLLREPDWDWAISGRERSLRALGRTQEADADFARWKETVGGESLEARTLEARRHIDAGDHEQALRLLERVIAEGDADGDVYNLTGFCLAKQDRHSEAKGMFERGLAADSDLSYLHRNYGETLLALDDPAGAQAHAETAIALNPRDDRAHRLRGLALVKLGRAAEALASLEQWVALAPQSVAALVQLIKTLQSLDRHADALSRCEEVIRLIPADGWGHLKKAQSHEALGQSANAKLAYQKAASSYFASGDASDAEYCRKAADNVGKQKRGLLGRLFGTKG